MIEIKREEWLKKIRPFYDQGDMIKVISGVRRCGKSTLMGQIRDEIIEKGVDYTHIIEINFEDYRFEKIRSANGLYHYLRERIIDEDMYYIFIDEIQHVRSFEKIINSFRVTDNVSIFVSGSNSKLLSGKLGTLLVGRTIEFRISPFSFKEAYEYKLEEGDNVSPYEYFNQYLEWGGFPERFKFNNLEEARIYLEETYKAIIEKDIIGKSNIDRERFFKISNYIMTYSGNLFSIDSIIKYFKENNDDEIERPVIYNYLNKMEEACLIKRVPRYDVKGKHLLKYIEKDYVVDTGLRRINTPSTRIQDTNFLENLIYNELVNRGYKVYVGKTYKGEVDFVVTSLNKKCYIQVTYVLASKEIIQREFDAFNPIKDACPKYVFSLDRWDFSGDGICNINIVDFLLGKRDILLT